MSDYQKALAVTFTSIGYAALSATLLGAAAVLVRMPSLTLDMPLLAFIEAMLLILLSICAADSEYRYFSE